MNERKFVTRKSLKMIVKFVDIEVLTRKRPKRAKIAFRVNINQGIPAVINGIMEIKFRNRGTISTA